MNKRKINSPRVSSSLNVTPLADVSLSLLLGFMVITPIIFQTLATELPQGAGVGSGQIQQDPIIEYTASRQLMINGSEVTMEELKERLDEFFPPGSDRQRKVMFTGSGEVVYDEIIAVLDALRGYGVESIGLR